MGWLKIELKLWENRVHCTTPNALKTFSEQWNSCTNTINSKIKIDVEGIDKILKNKVTT